MSKKRLQTGHWGERLAADYLAENGYKIVERNARTPYGEIDLIAWDDQELVFVEVKTRRGLLYGFPEESVHARKQEHLRAAAEAYIQLHPNIAMSWRIDVIAILHEPGKQPEITHFENAIRY